MIITVTANPAYDLTYRLDRFEYGAVQRVPEVEQRAGGKGINVARVLRALGSGCVATGFADAGFAAAAGRELPVDFVTCLPWVRRTVVISEANGTTTGLWEPGAPLADPGAARQLLARVGELLARARGLVISGSLPEGVDPSLPGELARLGRAAGVPVICDVDGEALRQAAQVPGVVLMPNADELRALTGAVTNTPEEVATVAAPLLAAGVGAIIATRGASGMVAVTPGGVWSARLPDPVTGNPTGAGDAAAAAMITALASPTRIPGPRADTHRHSSTDWPAALAAAVAVSAAAVVMPVAGEIDTDVRDRLLPAVVVEPVNVPDIQEFPCL
ncbi:hexose kinase [Nocardia sp. NPDC127526]|uniref:hexose kinase n=1 Tax=Nocardia sp. NPDC127526 TaxID=3345393 RepID=UPI003625E59F